MKTYYFSSLKKNDVRSLILHVLYSVESHEYIVSVDNIIIGYREFGLLFKNEEEQNNFISKIEKIIAKRHMIDEIIVPFLKNWTIDRISIMSILILRYSISEIFFEKEDHALIINEAVELAKGYSEDDSYKFVNGILDSIVKAKNLIELDKKK